MKSAICLGIIRLMQLMIQNNPTTKQDFTQFLHILKKIRPHNKILLVIEKKILSEEKAPPQQKETYSENYPSRRTSPKSYRSNTSDRSNAQRGHSDCPYVAYRNHSRSNTYSGFVRVEARPDRVNSLYDTLQLCNPLNQSSI